MKTMQWMTVVCGLALAACGGGSSTETAHDEHHHDHAQTAGAETTALVPVGEATVGDRSTCTVSGEEITITETTPRSEHDGRTYYFCCPHCQERFEANPHEFLSAEHDASHG